MRTTSSKFYEFFPYILVLKSKIFRIKFQSKLPPVVILWNIISYTKKKICYSSIISNLYNFNISQSREKMSHLPPNEMRMPVNNLAINMALRDCHNMVMF